MKHLLSLSWLMGALALTGLAHGEARAQGSGGLEPRMIVRLKPDHPPGTSAQEILQRSRRPLDAAAMTRLSARAGTELRWVKSLADGSHVLVSDRPHGPAAADLARRLRQAPEIERVEQDLPVAPALLPSDPNYSRMWHLQPPVRGSYGADFQTAWDLVRGNPDVRVAVIDTGVLPHPDLVGRGGSVSPASGALGSEGYDFISDCRVRGTCAAATPASSARVVPQPVALDRGDWISEADRATAFFSKCKASPSSWHGSRVAGTVAALGNNGEGIVGGAFETKLVPVRVLGKCGGYMSDVAEAIRWAAGVHPTIPNPTPAKVLNLSLGAPGSCGASLQNAISAATAAGALVVAAAGNDASDASTSMLPSCADVLVVAAHDKSGDLAYYSNYSSSRIALAAPGGDMRHGAWGGVLSLSNSGQTHHDENGWAHVWMQGTSFAAPHVAAAAALVRARNPALTPPQVRAVLVGSASVTGFPDASRCGSQGDCGAGMLNAGRAVANALSPLVPSRASINFGAAERDTVHTKALDVSNRALGAVAVGGLSLRGDGQFRLASDACSGQVLSPDQSCRVEVAFAAAADGRASGFLDIPARDGGEAGLATVALAAAVGSKLSVASSDLELPGLVVGRSTTLSLSILNRHTDTERVVRLELSGSDAAISADGCGNVELTPGASCELAVTVTPQRAGELWLELNASTAGADDVPLVVTMSGVAVEPADETAPLGSPAADGGGGGCTVLRSGGTPDLTLAVLALLALLAAGMRRPRRQADERAADRP